ncbi:MAG: hypothetical protein NVS9B9_29340 [Ktedonobacteraceae bacterium]
MTSHEIQTLLSKPNNAIVGVNRAVGGPQPFISTSAVGARKDTAK